ncbi:formimidoylglutamase [Corynebacterium sp. YIM 101645]|uniref:Formimidoylglutamase n=1 Tax=Corynebacterium lemuris TaxID=1859292 RepID=A0ABT2FVX1_9CORY|nr:formimidoylglutamase [Corynebacterium lemuris]MCS5478940.1 formimidoylglutamase [Corynebacterium lemuris]
MTSINRDFPASAWTGRDDGPGPEHARWHSVIGPLAGTPGVALLGFASEEGVRRNNGRLGAAEGPAAIRSALASLAVHDGIPRYDAGTITVEGEDLEGGHDALSDAVAELSRAGHLVVVLGGGHETAYGTHRGLREGLGAAPTIVNLDAHFDLRAAERPSSGTPFRQLAELAGPEFSYAVLGISRPNNTRALFDTAVELGVRVVTDEELMSLSPAQAAEQALQAVAGHEHIHLSIDLDVLPADIAPGVSAPAAFGVDMPRIQAITRALAATGRLRLIDVVELNPRFDVDARTARAAARLIEDAVHALPR